MARPSDVGSVGEALYERLAPLGYDDEAQDWALLILCGALGVMGQSLRDLVADSEAGPGWSSLLDVDRCPAPFLPFLAQFVGVRLPVGVAEAEARERIRTPAGFRRGTPAAIVAAAQRTLIGAKTVSLFERDGGAYRLTVVTRTSETPDTAATERAIRGEKPAGILLTYVVSASPIITELAGDIDSLAGTTNDL